MVWRVFLPFFLSLRCLECVCFSTCLWEVLLLLLSSRVPVMFAARAQTAGAVDGQGTKIGREGRGKGGTEGGRLSTGARIIARSGAPPTRPTATAAAASACFHNPARSLGPGSLRTRTDRLIQLRLFSSLTSWHHHVFTYSQHWSAMDGKNH